jgi:hypothetical protein
MIDKKLLSAACLSAALSFGAGSVFAAPYLSTPGGPGELDYVQELEDEDYEVLIRPNATGGGYSILDITPTTQIQVGDLFAGVLKIQQTQTQSPSNQNTSLQGDAETFTGIFLIEATDVTALSGDLALRDNGTDTQDFGAVGQSVWNAIYGSGGLIDISSAFDVSDLDGGGTGISSGTMAMLFNGVVFDDATEIGTLSASATSFVDGGTLQYEFGITGEQGATEFWSTRGEDSALPFYAATTSPQFKFSLNVTEQWAGPDLLEHNYRGLVAGDLTFGGPAQLQAQGTVSQLAAGTAWGVKTDTDLWIKVPVPAPLALLGLGMLGLGVANRRKKAA